MACPELVEESGTLDDRIEYVSNEFVGICV